MRELPLMAGYSLVVSGYLISKEIAGMRKVLGSVATLLGVLLVVIGITARPVLYDGLATVKLNQRSVSTSEGSGMSALYAHDVNGSAVFEKLTNAHLKSTRNVIGIPGRV